MLDAAVLVGFLASMLLSVYISSRRIGVDRKRSGYLTLSASAWMALLVLWFVMTLSGVRYTFEAGPDLSFSKLLYPIHLFFYLFPQGWFILVLVIFCPFIVLGTASIYRRRILTSKSSPADKAAVDPV
jgi:CDP-diglyceride synthetase